MNFKKIGLKIIYGVLSTALVFNHINTNHALCMDEYGSKPTPLPSGKILSQVEDDGLTLLHRAILDGNYNMVGALLELGASLDVPNKFGMTPFEMICDTLCKGYNRATERPINVKTDKIAAKWVCARLILEHCVKYNVRLTVDPRKFQKYSDRNDLNFWDWKLKKLFFKHKENYPKLFSCHR